MKRLMSDEDSGLVIGAEYEEETRLQAIQRIKQPFA
jgi:hypothetical protein